MKNKIKKKVVLTIFFILFGIVRLILDWRINDQNKIL